FGNNRYIRYIFCANHVKLYVLALERRRSVSMEMVRTFAELTPEQQASAGGKGGMLAKLYQKGYPVPDGLVVLPSAFQNGELDPQAWSQVQARLHTLRQDQQGEPSSE